MKLGTCTAALCLLVALGADAREDGWRDREGNRVPETDSQKSKDGLGGLLLLTDDPDWEAKWNTPEDNVPHFRESDTVRVGQSIVALIFVSNPSRDAEGNVHVKCDIRMVRPDGSLSVDQADQPCMVGPLPGDPMNVYLSDPVIGFLGEPADLVGIWTLYVTLKDVNRSTELELKAQFTYLNDDRRPE